MHSRIGMGGQRIHALDGIRGLAVVLVIVDHLRSAHTLHALDYLWRFDLLGNIGVRLFFVVSGYTITALLRAEFRATGRNDFRKFYLRRALRIGPAYYFFLLAMAIAAWAGMKDISWIGLMQAGAFVSNYCVMPFWLLHTWSLALEEQFYLLWPLTIAVLGWRRAGLAAVLFCAAAPLLRCLAASGQSPVPIYWTQFEHAGDAITWGCLYALFAERQTPAPGSARRSAALAVGALAALIALAMCGRWPMLWNALGSVAANLLIVVFLHNVAHAQGTLLHGILSSMPARSIGIISFSLYLWQQVVIYDGVSLGATGTLVILLLTATASYQCIEKPFLRLKARVGRSQPAVTVS